MLATHYTDFGLLLDTDDLPVDVQAEARRIALSYRIVIDWSTELGYTAACLELPRLVARSASADTCTESLFEQAASHVATLLMEGRKVLPSLRSAPHRPARPNEHVALPSVEVTKLSYTGDGEAIDPPSIEQIYRMAKWTADQYRLVIHWFDGSYYAVCAELPSASGFGATPSQCVGDIRRQLMRIVAGALMSNQMPPEPFQEVERRAHLKHAA